MRLIEIDGHPLAVGLTWRPLQGLASESREIAALAKAAGSRTGVVLRFGDMVLAGLAPKRVRGKHVAGAAWLALACRSHELDNIVYVESLSDAESWLCAIRNGAPVPDYDVVCPRHQIAALLGDLSQYQAMRVLSSDAMLPDSETVSFAALIDGIKPPLMGQVSGLRPAYVLLAVVVAAALLGGFAWQIHDERTRTQQGWSAQAGESERQAHEERGRTEQREREARTEIENRVLSTPSAQAMVDAWFVTLEAIPESMMGWRRGDIRCTRTECTVAWKRERVGTVDSFVAGAAERNWTVTARSANDAQVVFPVSAPARTGSAEEIPAHADFSARFTTQFQRMELAGLTFSLREPDANKKSDAPAAGAPPHRRGPGTSEPSGPRGPHGTGAALGPPGSRGAQPDASPWRTGTFDLNGKLLFELRDSADYLEKFTNVSLQSLRLELHKSWTVGGTYAVK